MRRSSSERLALVFLLSLSLTACGDDGTALPEVDLGPGTDFGTDQGTPEDLGTEDDLGTEEDLGVESDLGPDDGGPLDMPPTDAGPCTPFTTTGCASGEWCEPMEDLSGGTCAAAGSAVQGDECTETTDCAVGLLCAGGGAVHRRSRDDRGRASHGPSKTDPRARAGGRIAGRSRL